MLLALDLNEEFINSFIMDIIRYNMDKDYHKFSLYNGLSLSKRNYLTKLDELNEKIDSIKSMANRKAKINVVNKLETYDELMKQIGLIYDKIKEESKVLGGSSVYR